MTSLVAIHATKTGMHAKTAKSTPWSNFDFLLATIITST